MVSKLRCQLKVEQIEFYSISRPKGPQNDLSHVKPTGRAMASNDFTFVATRVTVGSVPSCSTNTFCHDQDADGGTGSKAEQETMRFSLGGPLGTGASSCVWAVDVERLAAGTRHKNKAVTLDSLRRRFAAKFFRPHHLPGPSALEREVKILATLPPSPYIGGFHGQFSVQLRDCCSLEELASKLQPKKVGTQQIAEEREVHEECHFILVDRSGIGVVWKPRDLRHKGFVILNMSVS